MWVINFYPWRESARKLHTRQASLSYIISILLALSICGYVHHYYQAKQVFLTQQIKKMKLTTIKTIKPKVDMPLPRDHLFFTLLEQINDMEKFICLDLLAFSHHQLKIAGGFADTVYNRQVMLSLDKSILVRDFHLSQLIAENGRLKFELKSNL